MLDDAEITVTRRTLGELWEESLRQLMALPHPAITDSVIGGPSIEASVVRLRALEPSVEPRVSEAFPDPGLVDLYRGMLDNHRRTPDDMRTTADRIYRFRGKAGAIDQFKRVADLLRQDPPSRRAIIQLWDPAEDLGSVGLTSPLSHCFLQFLVRDGAVNLFACSRSMDAWIGALPNMLAFFALQEKLAARLRLSTGSYAHVISSYHLYLRDVPAAARALGS